MAGYQKESGVCTGRGFSVASPNGYLAKFYTWVTKAYVDGGPQWYIIDDFSTAGNTIFAYISVDATADTITVTGHGLSHGHEVRVSSTGTLPGGLSEGSTYYVIRVDANKIKMAWSYNDAMAGNAIDLTSQGTGIHTLLSYEKFIVISDTAAPLANDYNTAPNGGPPKIVKVGYRDAESGYVRATYFMAWNTTSKTGRGVFGGKRIVTYDDADFAYDFRGGEECMIISARTGTTWSVAMIDDWEGMLGLVEGVDKIGVLQSNAFAGNSAVLHLDTGEAANFTVNKHYYIMDFSGATSEDIMCDYFKVEARDLEADTITVSNIEASFKAGSIVGAYIHRWYLAGTHNYDYSLSNANISYHNSNLPYYSSTTAEACFNRQASGVNYCYGSVKPDWFGTTIDRLAPDDDNFYTVMRLIFVETRPANTYYESSEMNRAYGRPKNMYVTKQGSMAAALDGRTINGDNWLFIVDLSGMTGTGCDTATLFRDSTHTS